MTRRATTERIIVHCSATRPSLDIGVERIREWHVARGWSDVGYAAVIRRSGLIEFGRHFDDVGAHVAGHNARTVGICLVGGLYENGREARDDFAGLFTTPQAHALRDLLRVLLAAYPSAEIVGHRDLSPDANKDGKITPNEWLKSCPGFDVGRWAAAHGF